MSRIDEMKKIQKQGLELFEKKNNDYGDSFFKTRFNRNIDKNF